MAPVLKSVMQLFSQTFARLMAWVFAMFFFFLLIGLLGNGNDARDQSIEVLPGHLLTKGPMQGDKIWEINLSGPMSSDTVNIQTLRKQAAFFASSPNKKGLKAVLLVVDSPGGSPSSGFELHYFVEQIRKTLDVPVYTYVEGTCASAAYLAAVPSNAIYACESALVGSVGVLARALNFSELMEKVGVKSKLLTRGEGKVELDSLSPWSENSEDETSSIQQIIDQNYALFVSKVAAKRPQLTIQRLEDELGARVFMAAQALELGYIDHVVVSKEQCLQSVVKKQELEKYALVRFKGRGALIERMLEMSVPEFASFCMASLCRQVSFKHL